MSLRILVEKFVALTHIGPRANTPLAPLAILLVLVPGPSAFEHDQHSFIRLRHFDVDLTPKALSLVE